MTEIINKDDPIATQSYTKNEEIHPRTEKVLATIEHWSKFDSKGIEEQVKHLNFIVDPWGRLIEYTSLILPEGWKLKTTSRDSSKPGTIILSSDVESKNSKINKAIKQYVSNHGLTLAQADTFIETLYYAKFLVLPLLTTVLNDKLLYRAYRTYSREQSLDEYFKWIRKNSLQHNEFNVKLTSIERVRLSEMLDRMVRADKQLRPMREQMRNKFNKPA